MKFTLSDLYFDLAEVRRQLAASTEEVERLRAENEALRRAASAQAQRSGGQHDWRREAGGHTFRCIACGLRAGNPAVVSYHCGESLGLLGRTTGRGKALAEEEAS